MKKRTILFIARRLHDLLLCIGVVVWPIRKWIRSWFNQGERHVFWPCPLDANEPPTTKEPLLTPDGRELFFPVMGLPSIGHLRANIIPLFWPSSDVAKMLPDFMELAPQSIAPDGRHPVLMFLGHQHCVKPRPKPFHKATGLDYLEYILVVPFTQVAGPAIKYQGPYATMPRLFLDARFPVVLGRMVGYPKELACFDETDVSHYPVFDHVTRARILKGSFETVGPGFRKLDDSPSSNMIRQLLHQPLVGQRLLGLRVTTYLDTYLQYSEVWPVNAQLTIDQSFVPGVQTGSFEIPALTATALGAFRLASHWRLYPPLDVTDVRVRAAMAASA